VRREMNAFRESAFWDGVRMGIIIAWLLAGVPAAIILGAAGLYLHAGVCAFGFVLAVATANDMRRK
jgi:hypothetical protein